MFETPKQHGYGGQPPRQHLGLTQEALALAVNIGRWSIVDLAGGKETCQIGKALAGAKTVAIRLLDRAEDGVTAGDCGNGDFPDLDGQP